MIILSAFFSASETAFSSVNLIRLRQYADEGRPGAKKALNVAERFDEVLLAILIGNNVVNLASGIDCNYCSNRFIRRVRRCSCNRSYDDSNYYFW